MPKDRRVSSLSAARATVSPYTCSSKNSIHDKSESSLPHVGDEREWEEVKCPVCMEHPHNAVLILCSSHDKGCHPYMCNTSYRHSNCLDQFRLSSASSSTSLESTLNRQQPDLICPLCRGQISGWVVVEAARTFMNSKRRSCSLETCEFVGNYTELRKHARTEHPSVRPSDVDPRRQSEWTRLECDRDFQDTLSAYQAEFGSDFSEDDLRQLSLSENLFNFLDGVQSEAEDEVNDMSLSVDLELEFSFSFLDDLLFAPWAWDVPLDSISPISSRRSYNRRSVSSRSSSNYLFDAPPDGHHSPLSSRQMDHLQQQSQQHLDSTGSRRGHRLNDRRPTSSNYHWDSSPSRQLPPPSSRRIASSSQEALLRRRHPGANGYP